MGPPLIIAYIVPFKAEWVIEKEKKSEYNTSIKFSF